MNQNGKENRGICKVLISDWPLLLLILGSLVVGAAVYPQLPERVASHWNYKGEVDGYSSRFWGAFGIPLMNAGIYILMAVLPSIDPHKQNYEKFAGVYRLLKTILVIFMVGLYLVVIFSALGYRIPVDRAVTSGVALLFIVLGNFMGQIRHNYFVGIKTPWTLANEEVWQKTHRLGGRFWVAAGLISLVGSLAAGGSTGGIIMAVSLGVAVVVPIVYSYLEFRKLAR